jgi:hypothetical protein
MADKPQTTKATVKVEKIERMANSEKIGVLTYTTPGAPLAQTAKCWYEEAVAQIEVGKEQELEFYMKEPSNPKYPADAWVWTEYAKKGAGGRGGGRSWQPKSLAERYEAAADSALACASGIVKSAIEAGKSAEFFGPEPIAQATITVAKEFRDFIIDSGKMAPQQQEAAPAPQASQPAPQAAKTPEQAWYDERSGWDSVRRMRELCLENKWALDSVIRKAIENGVDSDSEVWGWVGTLEQRAKPQQPAQSVQAATDEYDPFAED